MQSRGERVVQAIMGAFGYVAGLLSALALGVVAVVGPMLGALAVVTWPIRALVERARRANRPPPPAGRS